jgi:hypothetical protein
MIHIERLFNVGDTVSINIGGMLRVGKVTSYDPLVSITIDCSTNLLQPKPEKYFWVGGVDEWLTAAQYARLGPRPV